MARGAAAGAIALGFVLATGQGAAAQGLDPRFDVAFGLDVMSDDIFKGITDSDGLPAAEVFIEPRFAWVYGVVGTYHVFGNPDDEVYFGAGIRPEVDGAEFNLGYIYTLKLNGDPATHTIVGGVEWEAADWLEVEKEVEFEFEPGDWELEGELGFAFSRGFWLAALGGTEASGDWWAEKRAGVELPYDFELSGGVGFAGMADPADQDYLFWNAGVSWTFRESATVDLRYYDTNHPAGTCPEVRCGPTIVAKLSVSTALSDWLGRGGDDEPADLD